MNIRDFVGVLRDLSFSDIRQEAMIPPRILVTASTFEQGMTWRTALFGDESVPFVDVIDAERREVDPLAYDALISIGPLEPERARAWVDLFQRSQEEMPFIEVQPTQPGDEAELERTRRRICDVCRDRNIAFGRYIEMMRGAAAAEIVADTSRVNAQFAAVSNIPAMVPVIGTIMAAGADFLVLTKNQLMMMYRLAAIYDRELDNRWRVYSELMPVVGAGLLWRTAARQVAAVLPFALGAVPKVAIAFAGTYAVGQAARVYYERGDKLTRQELDEVYREALVTLGSFRQRILSRRTNSGEQISIPVRSRTSET